MTLTLDSYLIWLLGSTLVGALIAFARLAALVGSFMKRSDQDRLSVTDRLTGLSTRLHQVEQGLARIEGRLLK